MSKIQTSHNRVITPYLWCGTAFFSNACLMMLELAAGRMLAQDTGSSLYTWTAVIGVVLAGMTAGNYLGGRFSDRFISRKLIAILFTFASMNCVVIIVLSRRISGWSILWGMEWPVYVLVYVGILFFTPSVLLGMISPISAKAALEGQTEKGRIIGIINACCAAGSIAGTFLAGFWIISAIGISGVIWASAAALLAAGLIFEPRYRALQLWCMIFIVLMFLGISPTGSAERIGTSLTLRDEADPNVIYEDQTNYCRIRVKRESFIPDARSFYQDKLKHSAIVMDDINNLQYGYSKIYATATEMKFGATENPAFLAIGGGGFAFPRYLKHRWPEARVDVAEIDPGVIRAAIEAFGLPKDHGINIYTMDGRNFVDGLINKSSGVPDSEFYDCIFGDAYDNFSVPYQLVTREFNEKIARILKKDGIYMLNLIDFYPSGLVLGSILNTLEQTFKNVYIIAPAFEYYNRTTFVLLASRGSIDINNVMTELAKHNSEVWLLSKQEVSELREKSSGVVLSDDYAPIDNLAGPIANQGGKDHIAHVYIAKGVNHGRNGQWGEAIAAYMKAAEIYPTLPVASYRLISENLMSMREFQEAAYICRQALSYYDRPQIRNDISSINLNMGIALKAMNRTEESKQYLDRAIEGYKRRLVTDPNDAAVLSNLGLAFAEMGEFSEATIYFRRATEISPSNSRYRYMLAESLLLQKDYAGAEAAIRDSINAMRHYGNHDAIAGLQQLLGRLVYEQSQRTK